MKAKVDKAGCICCGLCVNTCPELFRLDENGVAETYAHVSPELEDNAMQAHDECPVQVILIED